VAVINRTTDRRLRKLVNNLEKKEVTLCGQKNILEKVVVDIFHPTFKRKTSSSLQDLILIHRRVSQIIAQSLADFISEFVSAELCEKLRETLL